MQRSNGLMDLIAFGQMAGEITTYDSLDHSLGQARNNIYLAGKCWASYLALDQMLAALSEPDAASEALRVLLCGLINSGF